MIFFNTLKNMTINDWLKGIRGFKESMIRVNEGTAFTAVRIIGEGYTLSLYPCEWSYHFIVLVWTMKPVNG